MRVFSKSSVLCLAVLMGCTSMKEKPQHVAVHSDPMRTVASVNELVSSKAALADRMDQLMTGIFHAYLMSQVHLAEFDRLSIHGGKEQPMRSQSYANLLAIKSLVDELEHNVTDLYKDLVLVTALPQYTPEQKFNADMGLKAMGKYMDGFRTDKTSIPENLKPLVLMRLREKQTELYQDLKEVHDGSSDNEIKQTIHKNMVLLRATRMAFYKDLKNYTIDQKVLKKALKEESKKESFKDFEKQVNELSKDMKVMISEVGREVSSENAWVNIDGYKYPANTWSMTYDDGPQEKDGQGRKLTPDAIKNLQDRNMKATFFMLAKMVDADKTGVGIQVRDAGMDIASHTYDHKQLTKTPVAEYEHQIGDAKKVIEKKLDVKVKLMRLPYGAGVERGTHPVLKNTIAKHEMIHVYWTVDSNDWARPNPNDILVKTVAEMKRAGNKKGIILFHDIHRKSVDGSAMLIDHINKENPNAIWCTVQGVIDQQAQNLPSCK